MSALINRSKARQELRQLIKGTEIVEFVVRVADELYALGTKSSPSPAAVGALKASAELKLRMLDKVLPDLKSVEHDMGEGLASLSDTDLHGRIRDLLERLNAAGLLEGGSAGTGDPAARGSTTVQ